MIEVKKRLSQIDYVETKYKEKKYSILDTLKKENDFYENALSKMRLEI
jgi:hypothetical protein